MDRDPPTDEANGPPELDLALLPMFQRYKEENASWIANFDEWSYLNLRADLDLAVAFTKLFWPDFVEVHSCVLLKRNYTPESLAEWLQHFGGDLRSAEAMINHVHVYDLFLNDRNRAEYKDALYQYMAEALVFGWKQALRAAYPDKQFVVEWHQGYGPEVTFYQADPEERG